MNYWQKLNKLCIVSDNYITIYRSDFSFCNKWDNFIPLPKIFWITTETVIMPSRKQLYFIENTLFSFSNCRKLSNHHYLQLFCTLITLDSKFKKASFYANVNSNKKSNVRTRFAICSLKPKENLNVQLMKLKYWS